MDYQHIWSERRPRGYPGQRCPALRHHRYMRWTPGGRSSDLEDRRGAGPGLRLGGSLGIGGILLLLLLSLIFKRDFLSLVGNGVAPVADSQSQPLSDPSEEPPSAVRVFRTRRCTTYMARYICTARKGLSQCQASPVPKLRRFCLRSSLLSDRALLLSPRGKGIH